LPSSPSTLSSSVAAPTISSMSVYVLTTHINLIYGLSLPRIASFVQHREFSPAETTYPIAQNISTPAPWVPV
jgi:hypothetical protein